MGNSPRRTIWTGTVQLLQNITNHKDGSKHSILELLEAERNLVLCFQRTKMLVNNYTRELKASVEVCEAAGLRPGAMKSVANIVAEGENLSASLVSGEKLKEYLKKGVEHCSAILHFLGINNMAYEELKQSVKKHPDDPTGKRCP